MKWREYIFFFFSLNFIYCVCNIVPLEQRKGASRSGGWRDSHSSASVDSSPPRYESFSGSPSPACSSPCSSSAASSGGLRTPLPGTKCRRFEQPKKVESPSSTRRDSQGSVFLLEGVADCPTQYSLLPYCNCNLCSHSWTGLAGKSQLLDPFSLSLSLLFQDMECFHFLLFISILRLRLQSRGRGILPFVTSTILWKNKAKLHLITILATETDHT